MSHAYKIESSQKVLYMKKVLTKIVDMWPKSIYTRLVVGGIA